MEPERAADLVRKLRAKARSTTFPEEAKLLTDKADKLAKRYRITEEVPSVRQARPWPPRGARRPPYYARRPARAPDPGVNGAGDLTF